MEKEKWRRTRLIAFESRIGSHLNPKSLPRSIEGYLPLDKKRKSRVSPEMKELYKKRRAEYDAKKAANERKIVNFKRARE